MNEAKTYKKKWGDRSDARRIKDITGLQKETRDFIPFGAILDERIADGFYFARSLKLVKYIMLHPEMLDKPLGEASGFEYK